jgi:hypothetical protein
LSTGETNLGSAVRIGQFKFDRALPCPRTTIPAIS